MGILNLFRKSEEWETEGLANPYLPPKEACPRIKFFEDDETLGSRENREMGALSKLSQLMVESREKYPAILEAKRFRDAMQQLDSDVREVMSSIYRHGLARVLFTNQPRVIIEQNCAWLSKHADRTSYSQLALLADILRFLGQEKEAETTYEEALRAAKAGGYGIIE